MRLSSAFLTLCGSLSLSLHVAALAHSPQAINRWLLERSPSFSRFTIQDAQSEGSLAASNMDGEFPEQWFTQPLDHFSKGSPTFRQRFWVNKRHYVPGNNGPVIVIDGGETSGEDRLPFLDTGIADILAQATGGVGVVLEHRYVRMGGVATCPSNHLSAVTMVSQSPTLRNIRILELTQISGDSIPVANLTTDSLR